MNRPRTNWPVGGGGVTSSRDLHPKSRWPSKSCCRCTLQFDFPQSPTHDGQIYGRFGRSACECCCCIRYPITLIPVLSDGIAFGLRCTDCRTGSLLKFRRITNRLISPSKAQVLLDRISDPYPDCDLVFFLRSAFEILCGLPAEALVLLWFGSRFGSSFRSEP